MYLFIKSTSVNHSRFLQIKCIALFSCDPFKNEDFIKASFPLTLRTKGPPVLEEEKNVYQFTRE